MPSTMNPTDKTRLAYFSDIYNVGFFCPAAKSFVSAASSAFEASKKITKNRIFTTFVTVL